MYKWYMTYEGYTHVYIPFFKQQTMINVYTIYKGYTHVYTLFQAIDWQTMMNHIIMIDKGYTHGIHFLSNGQTNDDKWYIRYEWYTHVEHPLFSGNRQTYDYKWCMIYKWYTHVDILFFQATNDDNWYTICKVYTHVYTLVFSPGKRLTNENESYNYDI